jgi:iron complex outermembrane recepter protein
MLAAAVSSILYAGGAAVAQITPPATSLSEDVAEVVVTGSRIVRRDLQSASPVVTVETQAFEESSTLSVESVLNELPQFVPANTQFNTADVFPSATTTPGISTVSMRGLGSNRTLVLVDGRRFQPANSTLVIDTNSIPSSALESVEIISGGASAVYGADALGGVTNFKLKNKFQGIDLQFRSGITEEGDGEENRVSLLLGSSIDGGRGNAMLGMEYTKRDEVLAMDREFFRNGLKDQQTNSTSNARLSRFGYEPSTTNMTAGSIRAFTNAANTLYGIPTNTTNTTITAAVDVPTNSGFLFNDDGTLFKIERRGLGFDGDIANDPRYKITPSGTLTENNFDLRYSSPMTRYSLFGKADYSITDSLKAFATVNFVSTTNTQVLQPSGAVGGFGASIPYSNTMIYGPSRNPTTGATLAEYQAGGAYGLSCPATGGCTFAQAFPVSPELASLLNARGPNVFPTTNTARTFDPVTGVEIPAQGIDARWALGATMDFLGPRTIDNTTNLFQVLAGFSGDLGLGDWTWESYVSHGATRTDLEYSGFVSTRRFQALVQAPNYGRGATLTGIASAVATCTTGLPVFQQFQVSQNCIDAITANYIDRTRITQDIVELSAQGGIVDLPMGEMRGAVGATYRKNDFHYFPDATRESNSIIDIPVGAFAQANVDGSTRVREGYGELLVPILKDLVAAKSLELELGYRYSDYDISGPVSTYKILISWQPIEFVRVRGGYQKANRAPNINELFLDASSQAVTMRAAEYCHSTTRELTGNNPANPNRAGVWALCEAIIGNTTSQFSTNPGTYTGGRSDGVILQASSGNRNLKSEDGSTWTAGVVLSSPIDQAWISRTTLSVDWYQARITNAISALSAQTAYDLCFNRDGVSNPNYSIDGANGICRNITRDPVTGVALEVNSQFQNVGVIYTKGIDATFNWRASFADMGMQVMPGSLSLNVSYNKLLNFLAQESANSIALENKGTLARGGLFDWRLVTTLRYMHTGNWDVGLNWRHLPSVRNALYVTDRNTTVKGAGAYDIFGLTGSWSITKNWGISGGVDNLFNRDPERVGAGQVQNIAAFSGGGTTVLNGNAATNSQFYDVLGRRYFINLKMNF